MKAKLQSLIQQAAARAAEKGDLPRVAFPAVEIQEPKFEAHGDLATNFAMTAASLCKMPPRAIAAALLAHLEDPEGMLERTEIAGPGFINFFLRPASWLPVLEAVHQEGDRYGASDVGAGTRVQVEFVSANPTGPLHVGHGRGAAVGDSVANILAFCGYEVEREYYINDSGRQINTLGRSVFLRYQALCGKDVPFPEECYQGEYITHLAADINAAKGEALLQVPEAEAVAFCARHAADRILEGIRTDLADFGVTFDVWFSEESLFAAGKVEEAIRRFRYSGDIYEKDGALWFATTRHGDEKDRVVVRQNGQTTYFASDIAYHQDKFGRGFDRVIDVWGADHHGYIPRLTASIAASGRDKDRFRVILVQLVNLLREGEPVAMSTRAGEFVTLADVVKEVGRDAARFIFLTRHYESPLDFDLEVAKKQTNENPVYYVQYVHARITSILRKGEENGVLAAGFQKAAAARLTAPEELSLLKIMARYPEVVRSAADCREPHRITFYLMDLAAAFHAYYNKHRVLGEDEVLTQARLQLVTAVRQTIRNGLTLLGVSAPDTM